MAIPVGAYIGMTKGMGRFTGTTSALANLPAMNKLVMPDSFKGCNRVYFDEGPQGEGVYLEGGTGGGDTGRSGMNSPAAEVTAEAGQFTNAKIINLSTNVWVIVYDDGGDSNKGKAVVLTKSGNTITAGTAVEFNAAATNSMDAKRLSDTTFVVAYADNGGDDYLCARIGTVTVATPTVAFGTEKELTAAAIDVSDERTVGVAVARSTVLAFAYQLAGDSKGYIIAATFSGTTIATPGTAVEFEAGETHTIGMDEIGVGRVVIGYVDDDDSDYAKTVTCTVSAAAVCVAGTAETHTGAAATFIEVHKAEENRGIMSWIDSGDLHMFAFDIGTSGTTLAEGADATLAGTHISLSGTLFNNVEGVLSFVDDVLVTDHLAYQYFSIAWAAIGSGGVVTLSSTIDYATNANTDNGYIAANDQNEVVNLYDDAAASNVTNVKYGIYHEDGIFDIRSSAVSATWYATIGPLKDSPSDLVTLS